MGHIQVGDEHFLNHALLAFLLIRHVLSVHHLCCRCCRLAVELIRSLVLLLGSDRNVVLAEEGRIGVGMIVLRLLDARQA